MFNARPIFRTSCLDFIHQHQKGSTTMKRLSVGLLTAVLLLGTAFTAEAKSTTQQIVFGKDKTGITLNGKIKGRDVIDYQLRANANQTMRVDLMAGKAATYFNVLPPGSTGEAMFVGSIDGDHFKAKLPSNGVYTIRLYLMGAAKDENNTVNYLHT
jgi:hypothetical protein